MAKVSSIQMLTLFSGCHTGEAQSSVNLPETFRQISEIWENAETSKLEKRIVAENHLHVAVSVRNYVAYI